jgi:hypothetical protein
VPDFLGLPKFLAGRILGAALIRPSSALKNRQESMMESFDPRAQDRVISILHRHAATLPPDMREAVEEALGKGRINSTIVESNDRLIVHVSLLSDTGSRLLMDLDGARLGLHLVDGEIVYIDEPIAE